MQPKPETPSQASSLNPPETGTAVRFGVPSSGYRARLCSPRGSGSKGCPQVYLRRRAHGCADVESLTYKTSGERHCRLLLASGGAQASRFRAQLCKGSRQIRTPPSIFTYHRAHVYTLYFGATCGLHRRPSRVQFHLNSKMAVGTGYHWPRARERAQVGAPAEIFLVLAVTASVSPHERMRCCGCARDRRTGGRDCADSARDYSGASVDNPDTLGARATRCHRTHEALHINTSPPPIPESSARGIARRARRSLSSRASHLQRKARRRRKAGRCAGNPCLRLDLAVLRNGHQRTACDSATVLLT
jgi:hypothetical protein